MGAGYDFTATARVDKPGTHPITGEILYVEISNRCMYVESTWKFPFAPFTFLI
jgi:hypothetical protein